MKESKRIFLIFILLSAFSALQLSAFLIGCAKKEVEDIHREKDYPVSVAEVRTEDLAEFLFYSGDIEAKIEAMVYSKVTGKLVENKVQEGDVVKKGETLALVDRDEIGYEFELAPVESPIEGIVGRAYLDRGASVTLSTPIALVVNMDEVLVRIDVTEKDLPKAIKGLSAEVKVDAYQDVVFVGQVQKVSPVVDLATRTAPAWINIDNPQHQLKPGMFGRIKMKIGEHKGVPVIMRESVITQDSQRYVFVVKNNRAYKRKVKLGLSSDGKFRVLDGLKAGEKVIVMGPADLKDADTVKIVEEVK